MKKDGKKGDDSGANPSTGSGAGEDDLVKKIQKLKEEEEGAVHDTYQVQIEELEKAKEEADSRALRALAELKNAQQRMENDKASFAAFATQGVVLQVLEIYENYSRLLSHEPEGLDEEWRKGFEMIEQQFKKFMEQNGVSLVDPQPGEKIDPEKHEAMMTGEGEKDVILEVFSKGYELSGRVIKASRVKVGQG